MAMNDLIQLILNSEDVLMEKVLVYAKERDYTRYTSTLKEAWRMSISGLSDALVKSMQTGNVIPEMGPDEDFNVNEIAKFGVSEAKKHRSRGITLEMFLGLMKYYRQAYEDIVEESLFPPEEKQYDLKYIRRYFDFVEIGFASEWAGVDKEGSLHDLREANRKMTNEKNKYLTVFESIYDPIILVDYNNNVENINFRAAEVFTGEKVSGANYYGSLDETVDLDLLKKELTVFLEMDQTEFIQEKTIETKEGLRTYSVKFKKMMDVSEKYGGTVIILNDITERLKIENELKKQYEMLEYYAETDPMTGMLNRRTGILMLEKELARLSRNGSPLSVCFFDIDGLKMVNDTYGHMEGDILIVSIALAVESIIRESDIMCRMGGDEFLIVFPNCTEVGADKIVRKIIDEINVSEALSGKPYKHSFSYGIVELPAGAESNANDVIRLADQKMYLQKMSKKSAAGGIGVAAPGSGD